MSPPPDASFPDLTKASYIITAGQPAPAELAPIDALLSVYNDPAQLAKLNQAYDGARGPLKGAHHLAMFRRSKESHLAVFFRNP